MCDQLGLERHAAQDHSVLYQGRRPRLPEAGRAGLQWRSLEGVRRLAAAQAWLRCTCNVTDDNGGRVSTRQEWRIMNDGPASLWTAQGADEGFLHRSNGCGVGKFLAQRP